MASIQIKEGSNIDTQKGHGGIGKVFLAIVIVND
jgi:hypothetical protein